jgi:1-acyl-sn-glycerol-3-phosphate acyltransferase
MDTVRSFRRHKTEAQARNRFLGQFMSLSNAVFVDRANRKSALSTFGKVAQQMKQKGVSLFIFAEGTRHASKTPTILPLKVCALPNY